MMIGWRCKPHTRNIQQIATVQANKIVIPNRYNFEDISIVPNNWPRERLQLIAGTHDPNAQKFVNSFSASESFQSINYFSKIIDRLHEEWRNFTIQLVVNSKELHAKNQFVFINDEANLSESEKSMAAKSKQVLLYKHIGMHSREP